MALFTADNPLKAGIALCWASLLALPIGLLAIGGGPCAGPRNLAGSLILLVTGLFAVGAPVFGMRRLLQFFRPAGAAAKVLAVISAVCGCFVVVVGGFYVFFGVITFASFLRYR